MDVTTGYLIAGSLLVVMALGGSFLERLPLTTSIIYLAAGIALGGYGAGVLTLDPIDDSTILHYFAEFAVIVSLFTAGLKLRIEWSDRRWLLPVRLAVVSMMITVGLVAILGMIGLGLSAGAAILLGAILAPTDPVLASEVAVVNPQDQDRLRLSLTGEAGLNDGAAFPFVMLGLGLLGLHELGSFGWRWVAVDLVWAIVGGLAIGALLGTLVGHLVVYLRREHHKALGLDEFLTLGLIALAYGMALLAHSYGFLAVFAAGLALRRVEHRLTGQGFDEAMEEVIHSDHETATRAETAPVHMAEEILGFNEKVGRISEVALVVVIGSLISTQFFTGEAIVFVLLLILAIRPVSALIGLKGSRTNRTERRLIAWFGIRGIGSIYYLMFAIDHGLPEETAEQLIGLTLTAIAASVLLHGVSVTPLMHWYEQRGSRASRPRNA